MIESIDPIDFIEAALPQCENVADLAFVKDELGSMQRDVQLAVLHALVEEDDRHERVGLVDYLVMFEEQLLKAHQRYVSHLRDRAGL